jgi:hypothetical protein
MSVSHQGKSPDFFSASLRPFCGTNTWKFDYKYY